MATLPVSLVGSPAPRAERPACPHCGGDRPRKHGFFVLRDGSRQQRYLCRSCNRSFNPATGTPIANLKKRTQWAQMAAQMPESSPLRQMAALLGVHLSTAFRWRHRWLGELCVQPRPALTGRVALGLAYIRYSEKGSRTGLGPGSYGYWDWLRRGPRPGGAPPRDPSRPRFRRFIHGRPTCVLLAQNEQGQTTLLLGQGRPDVDYLEFSVDQLVAGGVAVYGFGDAPFAEACRRLDLPYQNGWLAAQNYWSRPVEEREGQFRPILSPEPPHLWLRQFRGVATRYLHHYMAWFSLWMSHSCG